MNRKKLLHCFFSFARFTFLCPLLPLFRSIFFYIHLCLARKKTDETKVEIHVRAKAVLHRLGKRIYTKIRKWLKARTEKKIIHKKNFTTIKARKQAPQHKFVRKKTVRSVETTQICEPAGVCTPRAKETEKNGRHNNRKFLFKHQRIQHHGSIIIMKKKEEKKLSGKTEQKVFIVCVFFFTCRLRTKMGL